MNYKRCKACGLIFPAHRKYEVCPACGFDKQVFEEYRETVSEKRKRLIELHLHPIVVHFPQAMVMVIFAVSVAGLFYNGLYRSVMDNSVAVMAVILALSTPVAIIAGIIDAKARFKKLNTPYIKIKMISGMIFLAFALGIAFSLLLSLHQAFIIIFSLCCIACQLVLGSIGVKLMYTVVPGK